MKLLLVCLLAACGSSQPAPASQNAEPAPSTQQTEQAQTVVERPKQGETCGENDTCAEGLECISYYGIAGPQGPQFKSCEIRCKADTDCPTENRCATIADGPGQVCRPAN